MNAIDWSKAPEGTTHFGPNHDFLVENWFKRDECGWSIWECARWAVCRGGLQKLREETMVQRPPVQPWSGEGPPPVGTVCEFHGASAACPYDPWHPDLKDGDHVTIIAYFNDSVGQVAAFTFKARNENIAAIKVEQARPSAFRPIRTPEQIAAEERQKACLELLSDCFQDANAFALVQAGRLYDAGWRKQVAP